MDRNVDQVLANYTGAVALRKESVDRNLTTGTLNAEIIKSLSARRAWIEMFSIPKFLYFLKVALRKESVDRNAEAVPAMTKQARRSPQGERG